jgi:hypothetical protein
MDIIKPFNDQDLKCQYMPVFLGLTPKITATNASFWQLNQQQATHYYIQQWLEPSLGLKRLMT